MSRTIELPESVYENLEKTARERGMTASDWIASVLPSETEAAKQERLHKEMMSLIGAFDSREPGPKDPPTPFSDMILDKCERQGLRLR